MLKIFGSKEKFLEGLRLRIDNQVTKIICKYFLIAPKYLYKSLRDLLYLFFSDIIDFKLNVYKISIDEEYNSTDFVNKMVEKFVIDKDCLVDIGNSNISNYKKVEKLEKKLPLFIRIIFPILSPVYYFLGGPIFAIFINKISNNIVDFIMEDVNKDFLKYFYEIIISFNRAIDSLKIISENFKNIYNENKRELK